jgi:signal transduction histidine kinase
LTVTFALPDDAGRPVETCTIATDVTERKTLASVTEERRSALEALRENERLLRASRARIVKAGDEERRRLERNLHDGAQQRLVSLALTLQLAEATVEHDPVEAACLLADARNELVLALDELRELARGIHPPALADRGLALALEALAARSSLPVEVVARLPTDLPAPVEVAAYYVAAEGLTNVVKYARASAATVRAEVIDQHVVLSIRDDGTGGARTDRGSGLRGLIDRVEALGGRLDVDSPPGHGTTLTARIPCAS